jgi:hypothetical protein
MNHVKVYYLVFEAPLLILSLQRQFPTTAAILTLLLFLFDVFSAKDGGLSVPQAGDRRHMETTQVHIDRLKRRGVSLTCNVALVSNLTQHGINVFVSVLKEDLWVEVEGAGFRLDWTFLLVNCFHDLVKHFLHFL